MRQISDDSASSDYDRPLRTACPSCVCRGIRPVERVGVNTHTGVGFIALVGEVCQNCGGQGWREGFQPPV